MKTKKFTLLQLFNVVDGRLSTSIDDVYAILNHVFNTSVWTHQIPEYMDRLKAARPLWFTVIEGEINALKRLHNDDFNSIIKAIREEIHVEFDIPKL